MVTQTKHVRTSKLGKKFTAGKRKPKVYYWKYDKKTVNRTYGGTHATVSVYKTTPDGLLKLGETDWNTRSYSGEDSEVFSFLYKKGEIPVEMWKERSGYYGYDLGEKHGIKIKGLDGI